MVISFAHLVGYYSEVCLLWCVGHLLRDQQLTLTLFDGMVTDS
jgi:hypothetical protein